MRRTRIQKPNPLKRAAAVNQQSLRDQRHRLQNSKRYSQGHSGLAVEFSDNQANRHCVSGSHAVRNPSVDLQDTSDQAGGAACIEDLGVNPA